MAYFGISGGGRRWLLKSAHDKLAAKGFDKSRQDFSGMIHFDTPNRLL